MPAPLDRFLPRADVRKRHELVVHAPAPLVLETAREFDALSIGAVRGIFWLRGRILGARGQLRPWTRGLVDQSPRQ